MHWRSELFLLTKTSFPVPDRRWKGSGIRYVVGHVADIQTQPLFQNIDDVRH